MSERIENLRLAIETMHKCKAVHERSDVVIDFYENQKAWEGVVESFALSNHPRAKRCYAWSYLDRGETQYVTVLEIPPVESPATAVRVSIVSEGKEIHEG